MTNLSQSVVAAIAEQAPPVPILELQSYSYEQRLAVMSALTEQLARCGCWMLERKPLSLTQMEFRFELQLRGVVELYAALLSAGLELTRGSHHDITGLCMLHKHRSLAKHAALPGTLSSVVTVRLEITFLDEISAASVLTTGTAFA